ADRYAGSGDDWYFPGLAVETDGSAIIVHQIVPRTHLRSRVVRHLYVPDGADAALIEAVVAGAEAAAARDKARADAAQESCAAGNLPPEPPPSEAFTAFRARIRAVHAPACRTETSAARGRPIGAVDPMRTSSKQA